MPPSALGPDRPAGSRREVARLPSLAACYLRALWPRRHPPRGAPAPDLELVAREVRISREQIDRYRRACQFGPGELAPLCYGQIPASAALAQLLLEPGMPFPRLGLIHVASALVAHRPLGPGEPLEAWARIAGARESERGLQIDLAAQLRAGGVPCFESLTTLLARPRRRGARPRAGEEAPSPGTLLSRPWQLGAAVGRRYARASGDYNPIHLFGLGARLFGFPRPIAHGLYTLARALAELEAHLPAYPVRVDAAFKQPVLLPAAVVLDADASGGGVRFAVRSADRARLHLEGRAAPLAPSPPG